MRLRISLPGSVLAVMLAQVSWGQPASTQWTPFSLHVSCSIGERGTALDVTLRNDTTEDRALVMGSVWQGHYTPYSFAVVASLKDKTTRFPLLPASSPTIVPGPVDKWLLPLKGGSTYSLSLPDADFVDPYRRDPLRLSAVTEDVDIRVILENESRLTDADVELRWNLWMGTITSNSLTIPRDCRGRQ